MGEKTEASVQAVFFATVPPRQIYVYSLLRFYFKCHSKAFKFAMIKV